MRLEHLCLRHCARQCELNSERSRGGIHCHGACRGEGKMGSVPWCGSIEYNGNSIPWEHRAEVRLQWWEILDFKRDGEAGDGTPESPQGVVNPLGECFTAHRLCYQEGSGPRKHQSLPPQGTTEVLRAAVNELGLGGRWERLLEWGLLRPGSMAWEHSRLVPWMG